MESTTSPPLSMRSESCVPQRNGSFIKLQKFFGEEYATFESEMRAEELLAMQETPAPSPSVSPPISAPTSPQATLKRPHASLLNLLKR